MDDPGARPAMISRRQDDPPGGALIRQAAMTTSAALSDASGLVLLGLAVWLALAAPATRRTRAAVAQSKIGSLVRLRLSSKKPSVPATSSTPSHSFAAASPRGIGEITGPKNETPSTEITGVPTS